MARRKRKNPIPPYVPMNYGIPIAVPIVVGVLWIAGTISGEVTDANQKEREAEAEKEAEKEEKKAAREQQKADTTQSRVDAVNEQIAIREALSDAQIASEREKTQRVDSYREQVGLTGADFDAVLNDLYAAERANVEAVAMTALAEEQQELDIKQPKDNTTTIALLSLLGVATLGGAIYYKKRRA